MISVPVISPPKNVNTYSTAMISGPVISPLKNVNTYSTAVISGPVISPLKNVNTKSTGTRTKRNVKACDSDPCRNELLNWPRFSR